MPTKYNPERKKIEEVSRDEYIRINKQYLDLNKIKRIVFKVGSSPLENPIFFYNIADNLSRLVKEYNKEVLLVSSGAVMLGRKKLGHKKEDSIMSKQAYASVGQPILIDKYEAAFGEYKQEIGQILLTWNDLDKENEASYKNTVDTLEDLLKHKIIPIINENDTTSTKEMQFGENDILARLTTNAIDADLAVYITNLSGLYDKNPREKDNSIINLVPKIDEYILSISGDTKAENGNEFGTGGMKSKIESIKLLEKPTGLIIGKENFTIEKIFLDYTHNGTLFL